MWILKYNNILNLRGIYTGSFLGIFPQLFFKHVAVLAGSLTHMGLSVGMGYPAHSSSSA